MTTPLPQVTGNYFTEQDGVLAFASFVNKCQCIWRSTPNADVGIDGQIEYVDAEGKCTGQIVAVQVKSGASYLSDQDEDAILFRPDAKHVHYWREFPVPVLLVIFDPTENVFHWTDARHQLRATGDPDPVIRVPRSKHQGTPNNTAFFETAGVAADKVLEIPAVVKELAFAKIAGRNYSLSFFELFGLGLVDIGRKLYFSSSLCIDICEAQPGVDGLEFGREFYAFMDRYVRFLMAQNLVRYDFCDYLIDWNERMMTPLFVVPLTPRGNAVVDAMQALGKREALFYEANLGFVDDFAWTMPPRLRSIMRIEAQIRGEGATPSSASREQLE